MVCAFSYNYFRGVFSCRNMAAVPVFPAPVKKEEKQKILSLSMVSLCVFLAIHHKIIIFTIVSITFSVKTLSRSYNGQLNSLLYAFSAHYILYKQIARSKLISAYIQYMLCHKNVLCDKFKHVTCHKNTSVMLHSCED